MFQHVNDLSNRLLNMQMHVQEIRYTSDIGVENIFDIGLSSL